MSDHSDLKRFLEILDSTLDNVTNIVYNVRCKIRVEQELNEHGEQSPEEVSGPTESDALPVCTGQGGPELLSGTSKERTRSQNAAEKVQVRGGKMETTHGRT